MTAAFAEALCNAPSLTTLELERCTPLEDWIRSGYLETICGSTSLKQIRYHGMDCRDKVERMIARTKLSDTIAGRLKFLWDPADWDM